MLASAPAFDSSAQSVIPIEEQAFLAEYDESCQFDGLIPNNPPTSSFAGGECADTSSFWASSDNSNDSPDPLASFDDTWCPVKREPVDDCDVKAEHCSDSDSIAEEDCKQESVKSVMNFPSIPQQTIQPVASTNIAATVATASFPPVKASFAREQILFPGQPAAPVPPPLPVVVDCKKSDIQQAAAKACKKSAAPTRHRSYKQAKIAEAVVGSAPLPPDMELPAILGGKLPPRAFKSPAKRKHVYTERELKSRRKRGLPDDSDSESEERRMVRLPRRSLLAISTSQMTQFVTYMRSTLKLTPSQVDELCRQKRLVKNRECACRFRAKKELSLVEYRVRVDELENDIVSLRAENERLRQALREVSSNAAEIFLKQQQQQLQLPSASLN